MSDNAQRLIEIMDQVRVMAECTWDEGWHDERSRLGMDLPEAHSEVLRLAEALAPEAGKCAWRFLVEARRDWRWIRDSGSKAFGLWDEVWVSIQSAAVAVPDKADTPARALKSAQMGIGDLAVYFGLDKLQRNALAQQLSAFRDSHNSGEWTKTQARTQRDPTFLYSPEALRPLVKEIMRASFEKNKGAPL